MAVYNFVSWLFVYLHFCHLIRLEKAQSSHYPVLKKNKTKQKAFNRNDGGVGRVHTETAFPVPLTALRHLFSIVLV